MTDATRRPMNLKEAEDYLTSRGRALEIGEALVHGVKIRVWQNAPKTLRDVFCELSLFEERVAFVFEDERVTYRDFISQTRQLASILSKSGVKKGDRVLIALPNLPEWPCIFFSCTLIGAIACPISPTSSPKDLKSILANCEPSAVFADGMCHRTLSPILSEEGIERLIVLSRALPDSAEGHPFVRLNDFIALGARPGGIPEVPDVPLDSDDEAAIIYTSGTTGRPKGVLCTHRNIIANIPQSGLAVARSYLISGEKPPPSDPKADVPQANLLLAPLFHVSGFPATMLPLLRRGGKFVFMKYFVAERALELIERERVTITGAVPIVAIQLLNHPSRGKYDLSSLKQVSYGGAPSPRSIAQDIQSLGALPGNNWGMTETTGVFTNHSGYEYLARPDSCGRPAPVSDVKIMDVDGQRELGPGEAGEMWVRGPQVMKGYWRDPESTSQVLVDGWLKTGDIARVDDDGYVYIVDRAKNMVIRGGENIYCAEIEMVFQEDDRIEEVTVFGLPHPILGEELAAMIRPKVGAVLTEHGLRLAVARRLGAGKTPSRLYFTDEPLPRTSSGKVIKREVLRRLEVKTET